MNPEAIISLVAGIVALLVNLFFMFKVLDVVYALNKVVSELKATREEDRRFHTEMLAGKDSQIEALISIHEAISKN